MNQYIKAMLDTAGWKHIEKMFNESIAECESPSNISEDLDDATYAREVRANVIASTRMRQLLNNIKLSSKTTVKKDISYK